MSMGSSSSGVDPMSSSSGDVGGQGGSAGPGGGGGLMDLLKDPQVLKEISQLGSSVSGALSAHNKLSPQSREMLSKAIQHGIQGAQQKRSTTPFVGDMMQYITPEMASEVLMNLRIPNRRMNV